MPGVILVFMDVRSRIAALRERRTNAFQAYKDRSRIIRVFRHRDFRLLWIGAFVSFIGSWVQNVAQGWLVYQLTGSKELLGLVTFFGMVPVTFLGPIAGTLTDTLNRRWLLVITQSIFAAGALFLAIATYYRFVQYWHIVTVALLLGCVSAVEMPTRQSIVSSVVPPEDLPVAIPFNALTFNLSRLIGPAIAVFLLTTVGTASCYLLNAISFAALIFAGLAIKVDLSAKKKKAEPIKDLIVEGALYTMRDVKLRTLFVLESIVSVFGLFYLSQMPAIGAEMLHIGERYGNCVLAVGVGAVLAIIVLTQLADSRVRALLIRVSMTLFGIALIGLSFVRTEWQSYPIFAILGLCAITQFNTTNTLFQTLSPARLRGRVLAMHIWALSGVSPFGVLAFGYLAERMGLRFALEVGGACVLLGALWSWIYRKGLAGVDDSSSFYGIEAR